jgi:hypothetical protein
VQRCSGRRPGNQDVARFDRITVDAPGLGEQPAWRENRHSTRMDKKKMFADPVSNPSACKPPPGALL